MKYYNYNSPLELNNVNLIGGKAFNLRKMSFLTCPKWFVLTTDFFNEWLKDDKEKINSYLKNNKLEEISNIVLNKPFSLDTINEIKNKLSDNLYAVRSSAVNEDSINHSYAGIMESYLNIAKENVFDAIKRCYLSAYSKQAIEYNKYNNINFSDIQMAVIIQEMVDADYAGVINTINPITNNPDEIIISVVKGLGESLVSGQADSTDYFINDSNIKIRGEDFLSKNIIDKLLLITKEIIKRTDTFQDIEFAIKDKEVYFLQTRAIATYANINNKEKRIVLDNSNIIESYCGVTTPLTFSFAKEVYHKVYTQTLEAGRVNKKIINSLDSSLRELLYFYDNKVYYNLNSWYHLNSIFKGKKSSSNMENMMGVQSKLTNTKKVKMNIAQILKFGIIFLKRLKRMPKDSKLFINKFNEIVMPYVGCSFNTKNNQELIELYQSLEKNILNDFSTPIINDCGAMVYYAMLTRFVKKINILDKDGYISYLVGRQGDVLSATSAPLFLNILNDIKNNAEIKIDFNTLNSKELYEKYQYNSKLSTSIDEYIKIFGPRVMDELKLETITLIEDPIFLYDMLKNYLINDIDFIGHEPNNDFNVHVSLLKRPLFKHLVKKTKYFIKNRESLRLKRTYIYSVVRNIFISIGNNFKNLNLINESKDIFYLTKHEIFSYIKENEIIDFKSLIQNRKKEYDVNKTKETYNRLVIYGAQVLPIYTEQETSNSNILKGIPSGAGVVSGRAKLVTNPNEALLKKDDIMLALRTDPGWIPLFPLCKGIVVEKGSILSHSAVVAREMGIPAVVGVSGATTIIKNNMQIKVDGIKGEVEIYEELL